MPKVRKISEPDWLADTCRREWRPAQLAGDMLPTFARTIPREKLLAVYASGTGAAGPEFSRPGVSVSGELVAGCDVYRLDWRDRKPVNKDWYAFVRPHAQPHLLLLVGPFKSQDPASADEHWQDGIPAALEGAEVLCGTKKDGGGG